MRHGEGAVFALDARPPRLLVLKIFAAAPRALRRASVRSDAPAASAKSFGAVALDKRPVARQGGEAAYRDRRFGLPDRKIPADPHAKAAAPVGAAVEGYFGHNKKYHAISIECCQKWD